MCPGERQAWHAGSDDLGKRSLGNLMMLWQQGLPVSALVSQTRGWASACQAWNMTQTLTLVILHQSPGVPLSFNWGRFGRKKKKQQQPSNPPPFCVYLSTLSSTLILFVINLCWLRSAFFRNKGQRMNRHSRKILSFLEPQTQMFNQRCLDFEVN